LVRAHLILEEDAMSIQLPMLPLGNLSSELADLEGGTGANPFGAASAFPSLDNVASPYPQQSSLGQLGNLLGDMNPMQSPASFLLGPLGGIGQFLSQLLAQFFGGNNGNGLGNGIGNGLGPEQYFTNATGASVGDPHLSFDGSTWDNMGSQPDLLNSNSFHGGYQLSTQTTPPNANGITYNQSATVSTNFGGTQVSLDNAGNATITQDGFSYQLQAGTTVDLGRGETATRNQDGSLAITCTNERGGEITTTMRENGRGVDVNTSAQNVDLGGALVRGRPVYQRY
jgi:hypothetical protein